MGRMVLVMAREGVTILTVVTARHRPALMRRTFPGMSGRVPRTAISRISCARCGERLPKFLRPPQMSLPGRLLRGSLVGPQERKVRQGVHAVAV
jgi:hypothetical protein